MLTYFKKTYEIWCRKVWLKHIDRETDRYHRMKRKLARQRYVVNKLVNSFNEAYHEEPTNPKEANNDVLTVR